MTRFMMAAALVLTPSWVAAQTDSRTMAQCAAIYAASQDGLRSENAIYVMAHGEDIWLTAAIAQAETEGADDPMAIVQATFTAKTSEWANDSGYEVPQDDYRYWMERCRLFAHDRGISLLP